MTLQLALQPPVSVKSAILCAFLFPLRMARYFRTKKPLASVQLQEVLDMTLEQINPVVHDVGLQHSDSWRTKVRRIYDHQFLYCFRGIAHFVSGSFSCTISRRCLLIIPPNTPHSFWVDVGDPAELYWVHLDLLPIDDGDWIYQYYNTPEKYVQLFAQELREKEHIRRNPIFENGYQLPFVVEFDGDSDEVEGIFSSIYKTYLHANAMFALTSKIKLLRLLEIIFSRSEDFCQRNRNITTYIGQMITYIKSNYYRKLLVEDICKSTGLHADYAGKIFCQSTGMTIINYLNTYRIEKARLLLMDADLSITDIAEMVGFQSIFYFSKIAKRVTGKSPSQLRKQLMDMAEQYDSKQLSYGNSK